MTCPNCGGNMIGDGFTAPVRCEFFDLKSDEPVDGSPLYCELEPSLEEKLAELADLHTALAGEVDLDYFGGEF